MNTYADINYEYNIFKEHFKFFENIEVGDKIYQNQNDDLLYLDKKCFYQGFIRTLKGENRGNTITYLNDLFNKYIEFLKEVDELIKYDRRAVIDEMIEEIIEMNISIIEGLSILVETYNNYELLRELYVKVDNIFRIFRFSTTISNSKIIP